ncbi:MAG TPA: hypothetical protein VN249_05420, partial [Prolixibacteraceae bacterium]|nr:hypothetical protein [Prolixibacteraceae bacterium]
GNMLPLGDENEILVKAVLDQIRGLKSQGLTNVSSLANAKSLFGSKDRLMFSRDMYVNPQRLVRRTR